MFCWGAVPRRFAPRVSETLTVRQRGELQIGGDTLGRGCLVALLRGRARRSRSGTGEEGGRHGCGPSTSSRRDLGTSTYPYTS